VVSALRWMGRADGFLEIVDQRQLPVKFVKLRCYSVERLFEAIQSLAIRGAPAIGVAGAYGLVLAMGKLKGTDVCEKGLDCLRAAAEYLVSSRPTAVNLSWAIERVLRAGQRFVEANSQADIKSLREFVFSQAQQICAEDVEMCHRIGLAGLRFIKDGCGVLTHCNAGALATAGEGTALSVLYEAHKAGRMFIVYVDETRPLLQGARLTAWELSQAGIETVVICDNTAGWLMKQGKIDVVITGADRIAANGDAANKIGTYSLSVLARRHNIPFYVAAPSSTFDLSADSGEQIPIEQRDADEVLRFGQMRAAAEGVGAYNPAFDVTDAADITAIITEKGVIEGPNSDKITRHLKEQQS